MAKSDFQLHDLPPQEWKKWDQFVIESPQGTVFQSSAYFTTFSEAFQRPVQILTVLDKDEIIGGVIIFPKSRGSIKYATSPYLLPYNGILLKDVSSIEPFYRRLKYQQKIINLLQSELEHRFHYCEISLSGKIMDLRNFVWQNWQIRPEYTIQIPLQSTKNLMVNIPHNQRRHIRKFEKEKFTFGEFSDFHICYELMSQSYRHHHMKPPINRSDFKNFSTKLYKKKLLVGYAILIQDKPAAFMLVIDHKPNVYALFSGKDFGHKRTEAELYLHWRILQLYRENNYDSLDLLGGMSPSISRVKLELGGVLTRHDFARYYKSVLIRLLLQIKLYRGMRQRRNI